ncbi:hypothetical protein MTR67_029708 [Solanum verrucosum]|uniref:Uncharacterized protein n=1 Tax=Solanum verrucosum TaxID=315347 RepID=A0AAF0U0X4_SOLVR|nr:hypothetical protein MTR67_029708 [Solanum verrucosum]
MRPTGGDPVTALNSKLVSASMAVSLFSFALFKYSKSEPSNEISALKNEASEKLGFSVKGWLPVSALPGAMMIAYFPFWAMFNYSIEKNLYLSWATQLWL